MRAASASSAGFIYVRNRVFAVVDTPCRGLEDTSLDCVMQVSHDRDPAVGCAGTDDAQFELQRRPDVKAEACPDDILVYRAHERSKLTFVRPPFEDPSNI